MLVHEYITPTYNGLTAVNYATSIGSPLNYGGVSDRDKLAWDVRQFTIIGATSTVLGAAAIFAGVIA